MSIKLKSDKSRILFVDFDGTICHDRFWRSLDTSTFEKIQKILFGKNKSMINEWMRGIHSSEDINHFISKELNLSFEYLWGHFVNDCENMTVAQEVLYGIEKLKNDFHTVLITDNMDCFTRFTVPALKLNLYFDLIVNSCESKKFKCDNNGEIFVHLLNEYNSKIDRSILIDNSQVVCDIISQRGGNVCLVTIEKPALFWLKKLVE